MTSQKKSPKSQKSLNEARNYFIFPYKLASGEERIVDIYSSPIDLQEKQVLFSIVHNITERKQSESALCESQLLYHSLVEGSPLSICRKYLAGRFTFANQRFLELSHIMLADLDGCRSISICTHQGWQKNTDVTIKPSWKASSGIH